MMDKENSLRSELGEIKKSSTEGSTEDTIEQGSGRRYLLEPGLDIKVLEGNHAIELEENPIPKQEIEDKDLSRFKSKFCKVVTNVAVPEMVDLTIKKRFSSYYYYYYYSSLTIFYPTFWPQKMPQITKCPSDRGPEGPPIGG